MSGRTLVRLLAGAAFATLAAAGSAQAAALEQTVPATIRLLYQEGRYGEFGVTYTDPDQSGDATIPTGVLGPGPVSCPATPGTCSRSTGNFAGAYKADLNDRLSYALTFDQPLRADTDYGRPDDFPLPAPFPSSLYDGTTADLKTYQMTAVVAYDVTPNVKVYGGLRAQRLDADATISFIPRTTA